MGPIVGNTADGRRQLVRARWALPSPARIQEESAATRAAKLSAKGKPYDMDDLIRMEPDRGVTNVRKLNLKHWRQWFSVEHRCIVPVTTFGEPDPASKEGGKVPNAWIGRDERKELMFFAGIHVRSGQASEGQGRAYDGRPVGFLTTKPNEIVKPVHFKAMPVLLITKEEADVWMKAPWKETQHLARPALSDAIMITSRGPYGSSIISKEGDPI